MVNKEGDFTANLKWLNMVKGLINVERNPDRGLQATGMGIFRKGWFFCFSKLCPHLKETCGNLMINE